MEQKHSGLGIASFVVSTATAVLIFLLFVVAGVMETSTPGGIDEESAGAVVLGLLIIFCLVLQLVALGLGIVGLCQNERQKIFAILGVVFSSLVALSTLVLIALGNSL